MTLKKPNINGIVFKIFPENKKLVLEGKCPTCKCIIKEEDFTDNLSKEEYSISGMCQKCQDSVFNNEQEK